MKMCIPISLGVVLFGAVGCLESKVPVSSGALMVNAEVGLSSLSKTLGPSIDSPPIETNLPSAVEVQIEEPALPPSHFSSKDELLKNCPIGDGFAYPVGAPDAEGYRDVQPFGRNRHLGEDWNGGHGKGGNGDLGDPIYSIADGIVTYAEPVDKNCGYGWGNVVKIVHNAGSAKNPEYVESLFAHLDEISVKEHQIVKRGEQIGTMGNCSGVYWSHLHFELRSEPFLSIGRGYGVNTRGYLDPKNFIEQHRFDRANPTGKLLFSGRPTPPRRGKKS